MSQRAGDLIRKPSGSNGADGKVTRLMPSGGTAVAGTGYTRSGMLPKPDLRSGTDYVRRGREAGAGVSPRTYSHRRAAPVQRELPAAGTRIQRDARGGKVRNAPRARPRTNDLTYAVVLLSGALTLAVAICCTLLLNRDPGGFSTHQRIATAVKRDRLGIGDLSPAKIVAGTWSGMPADGNAPTRVGTLQAESLRRLGQSRTAPGAVASVNLAPPEPARSSVNRAPQETNPLFLNVANHPSQPVPPRGLIQSRPSSARTAKTDLVAFENAPFPYASTHAWHGRWTSRSRGAGRTYSDQRVLLHIPAHFDPNRPAVMVVFFHGHGATLSRDVLARQQVPAQISESGINAVLVAPQFAFDARDSNPGKLGMPGAFAKFVAEAGTQLAKLYNHPGAEQKFAHMPIVLIAYSGGYLPAALSLQRGGAKDRIRGVVLLDALYGQLDKFAAWISGNPSSFFVSVYLGGTRNRNLELERQLSARDVPFSDSLNPNSLENGVTFLSVKQARHRDLVTHAYVDYPVKDLIGRLAEYRYEPRPVFVSTDHR
jgi:hypothetical protein